MANENTEQMQSLYVKSKKIYTKELPLGSKYNFLRKITVGITLFIFYVIPWLVINNRQAVLFELVNRRFYLFNTILYPQDLIYLTALLLVSAYGLFLVTAIGGRIWCGYTCPQTVYSFLFMWIEHKIEGDRPKQVKLDNSPMSNTKFIKKAFKHFIWLVLSLITGFTFVGYFTPIRQLVSSLPTFSFGPWELFWIVFYSFATYGNAGFMREQVCKYMCPYARFQSAMFDKDTLIITYDSERGEPRGARKKGVSTNLGDCVDCGLCVQVCPTGIDIRNGLQYECIGCAACVDACNFMMDKVGLPRGLVRYDTQNSLKLKSSKMSKLMAVFRPRVLVYSGLLLVVTTAVIWSFSVRVPFLVDVIKDRAALSRYTTNDTIENLYRIQIMNATEKKQAYKITVKGLDSASQLPFEISTNSVVELDPVEIKSVTVSVEVPANVVQSAAANIPTSSKIELNVSSLNNPEQVRKEQTTFTVLK